MYELPYLILYIRIFICILVNYWRLIMMLIEKCQVLVVPDPRTKKKPVFKQAS